MVESTMETLQRRHGTGLMDITHLQKIKYAESPKFT